MEFPFGVLPRAIAITASEWSVELRPGCESIISDWQARSWDNRWVHPPVVRCERSAGRDPKTGVPIYEPVPDTEHTAPMWRVPATHTLRYTGAMPLDPNEVKNGIAAFLVYLLGTLHGIELQHEDWALVGRQHRATGGAFVGYPAELAQILDEAAAWYDAQPAGDRQTTITSALFLHNHVPAYEFEWERFAWQYVVFDAAWYLLTNRRHGRHTQRLEECARIIGAASDPDEFARWIALRNDLLHQVLWGGVTPGHKPTASVQHAYFLLRSFTTVALLAAVGYSGPARSADWKSRGQYRL